VDVRIIAATNVSLREMTAQGRFREDLFYRLNVITVELPPLRERREDIPLLVQHFLDKYGEESRRDSLILSPEAMDRLMVYDWPGNVRELENVIERAVVLCPDREIGVDLLPDHVSGLPMTAEPVVVIPADGIHFREVIIGHERRYIEAALEAAGGVQKKAAELLHIKPTTLNEMMKRYDIRPKK
jgi:DNA-binding NtrC family response regulator